MDTSYDERKLLLQKPIKGDKRVLNLDMTHDMHDMRPWMVTHESGTICFGLLIQSARDFKWKATITKKLFDVFRKYFIFFKLIQSVFGIDFIKCF